MNRLTPLALTAALACLLAGCQDQTHWLSRTWEDFRYDRGWIGRAQAVKWTISDNPDERRKGIAILNRKGFDGLPKTEEYVRTLALNQAEASPVVRGAAVRAQVHGADDPETVPTLIAVLHDPDPYVRTEACIVLGKIADPAAIDPLIEVLGKDASSDVRAAAAEALAVFKDTKAALALADHVGGDDFLVAYTCREGLRYDTGEDLGYDRPKWTEWIKAQADPFANAGRLPPEPVKPEDRPGHWIGKTLLFWKTDPREVVE